MKLPPALVNLKLDTLVEAAADTGLVRWGGLATGSASFGVGTPRTASLLGISRRPAVPRLRVRDYFTAMVRIFCEVAALSSVTVRVMVKFPLLA